MSLLHSNIDLFFIRYCSRTDLRDSQDCQPGTYSTSNSSSCQYCPAGYMCPNTDKANV